MWSSGDVCGSAPTGDSLHAPLVQGAIEIVSRLRQGLCIVADTVMPVADQNRHVLEDFDRVTAAYRNVEAGMSRRSVSARESARY